MASGAPADGMWTARSVLAWIEGYLADHGIESPRISAQWLVCAALDCSRIGLYSDLDRPLSREERAELREMTRRRAAGEPLQYLTGRAPFRFLEYEVAPGVLIPRPETEVLVGEALEGLARRFPEDSCPHPRVLDACTGTGCIAIALATEAPRIEATAIDIDETALALARRNAEAHGCSDRVRVERADARSLAERYGEVSFELVVSNPPYIPSAEMAALPHEVAAFEPALALDGGADGLAVISPLIAGAWSLLADGGILALEGHESCMGAVRDAAEAQGFVEARIVNDLAGRPRHLIAVRPQREGN